MDTIITSNTFYQCIADRDPNALMDALMRYSCDLHYPLPQALTESNWFMTPFLHAINIQWIAGVEIFLDFGYRSTDAQPLLKTGLMLAAKHGNRELIALFLKAEPHTIDIVCDDNTAFRIATHKGDIDVVQMFIDAGSQLQPVQAKFHPFYVAVENGYLDIAKLLAETRPWMVHALCKGYHSFHIAMERANLGMIEWMLTSWPELIDVLGPNGESPFFFVMIGGMPEPLKFLLKRKPEMLNALQKIAKAEVRESLLYIAVRCGMIEMAKCLISLGADIDLPTSSGWTPLMIAVDKGRVEMVRLLVEAGTKATLISVRGMKCPLATASIRNELEIFQLLLTAAKNENPSFRPDLYVREYFEDGTQLMHYAVIRKHKNMVIALHTLGSPIDLPNAKGETPFVLANMRGCRSMIETLVKLQIQNLREIHQRWSQRSNHVPPITLAPFIDQLNTEMRRPLYYLAFLGDTRMIRLLVRLGSQAIHFTSLLDNNAIFVTMRGRRSDEHQLKVMRLLRSLQENPCEPLVFDQQLMLSINPDRRGWIDESLDEETILKFRHRVYFECSFVSQLLWWC